MRYTHHPPEQNTGFTFRFCLFFGLVFVANDSLVTRISIQDTGAVVTLESGWPNRNQLSSIRYASHQTRWPMRQFSTKKKRTPKEKKTSETHRHTKGRGRSSRCFGNDKPQRINIQQPKWLSSILIHFGDLSHFISLSLCFSSSSSSFLKNVLSFAIPALDDQTSPSDCSTFFQMHQQVIISFDMIGTRKSNIFLKK